MEKEKPRGSGAFFMGKCTIYFFTDPTAEAVGNSYPLKPWAKSLHSLFTIHHFTKNQTQTPDPYTSQIASHQRHRAAMDDDERFAVSR